jgi:hypothetical protein
MHGGLSKVLPNSALSSHRRNVRFGGGIVKRRSHAKPQLREFSQAVAERVLVQG